MDETATQRVAAALTSRQTPPRRDIERSLRDMWGLSSRQAKRFAAEGVKALGLTDEDDMLDRVKQLELAIRDKTQ
jgi:hypothetical protein